MTPLEEEDEIRLARSSIRVPRKQRDELAARLKTLGFRRAAEDLRSRRTFRREDCPGVLAVLNTWLMEVGVLRFGPDVMDLRDALDREINRSR